MAFLPWSESYSVGVEGIDEDHRALFEALKELETALARGVAEAEVGALLRRLSESAGGHFADEEALMRKVGYPGIALHAANHQRLMEKLHAFVARHGGSGVRLNEYALNFLRDWLVFHVENDDQRLGAWMQERVENLARARAGATQNG